jgi:hypothetical protein
LKRGTLLLGVGLAAYLVFALVSFPARVAVAWFAPPGVSLGGVQGTLWKGRAVMGAVAGVPFSDLTWDLNPLGLVVGRVSADITTKLADGFLEGHVAATPTRLLLTDLRGAASLGSFAQLLPLAGVDGLLTWQMERLEVVEQWPVRAIGRLRVAALSAVPYGVDNLGDYQIDFADRAAADGVRGMIKDTGGPIAVTGNLGLTAGCSYDLDVRVEGRAGVGEALSGGLAMLSDCQQAPDSSFQCRWSDSLCSP